MDHDWQSILSLGAEGGSITLLGKEHEPGQWMFRISVNEIFDDEPTTPSTIENAATQHTWDEAVASLEEYPWTMLNPRKIHPDFRKKVWTALLEKVEDRYKESFLSHRFDRWCRVCFPGYSREVITLASWLKSSRYTTILTGAGMSTESNIPDFRSKDGWWRNIDPRTVATVEALENHYDLFHEFYSKRIRALEEVTPHKGHEILSEWEKIGLIQAISTQNVDGFHSLAGNRHVHELHGSIHHVRCAQCSKPASKQAFLDKKECEQCGGNLRPGVVLFGEMLPEDSWSSSLHHIRNSELVIVIGTSLEVYPASQLPTLTKGRTVYLNAEIDTSTHSFDLMIQGKAGEVLGQVEAVLE